MKINRLAIILLLSVPIFTVSAQQNLVQNGGFEDGTSNWATDAGGDVTFTVVTEDPYEGANCMKAVVTTLGSDPWSIQIKNAFGPVVTESIYRASIYMKAATVGSTVNFTIGKATAGYDEYASAYGLELTTEWTEYVLEWTSSVSTSDDITLALHITGTDTYWFDEFEVVELVEEVTEAVINTSGNRIQLSFMTNLQEISEDTQTPFMVYSAENEYEVTNVTLHQIGNILTLSLSEPVHTEEEITVEYIPGTLKNVAGVEISPFSITAENNSEYTGPSAIAFSQNSGYKIYPQPATDYLQIENSGSSQINAIKIIDLSGKILMEESHIINKDVITFSVSDLQSGLYLLVVERADNSVEVAKIIKK